jgi:hypothetical protein
MNISFYFFAALTWFFSAMSLLTLFTGYPDPVMVIISVIFALGAGGFGLMAKLSIEPVIKIVEVSPEHLVNTLDQPAYQRRGLGHDEQQ